METDGYTMVTRQVHEGDHQSHNGCQHVTRWPPDGHTKETDGYMMVTRQVHEGDHQSHDGCQRVT